MTDQTEITQPLPARPAVARPVVYAFVAISMSQLALTLAAMGFAYTAIHNSEAKWCGTLGVFHRSYQINPPTTDAGRDIRRQLDDLYDNFGCSKVK